MLIRLCLFILIFSLPLATWLMAVPSPWEYVSSSTPPGQLLYILSKLFGLVAITGLTLQLSVALTKDVYPNRYIAIFGALFHYRLGFLTLAAVVTHVALFIGAASLRSGAFSSGLLMPNFSGFYNSMVSIGAIGFYLFLVLVLVGITLRKRIHKSKAIHKVLAWCSCFAIIIHSVAIGSETHLLVIRIFYCILLTILLISVISRQLNTVERT